MADTADFSSQLSAFMQATREQESSNNYTEAGGGAYQFETGTWQNAAKGAGVSVSAYPTANSAPSQVQDQVASYLMTSYYNGPAGQDWTKVAEMWNGGVPYPVPNPALGPGATTATYAAEVLAKFNAILGGSGTSGGSGGGTVDTSNSIFSIPVDIVSFFEEATNQLVSVAKFFAAFFEPSTYIRIGSGFFGTGFIIVGIYFLSKAARETQ